MRHTEQQAEQWFAENGYQYTVKRRLISKTVYTLTKNGESREFQLPSQINGTRAYLEMCRPILEGK